MMGQLGNVRTAVGFALLALLTVAACDDGTADDDALEDATETGADADADADGDVGADADADADGDVGADADVEPDAADDAGGGELPVGSWLWVRQVEDGTVVLEITEADLQTQVGPSGWEGCPSGIICTHYGIDKLQVEAGGVTKWIRNVVTSSDFEYFGSVSATGDLLHFRFDDHFSCAHPDVRDTELRERFSRYRIDGDGLLWLSVTSLTGELPFATSEPADPSLWLVFRPITAAEFDDDYAIRLCQAATDDECHPACFPERW